MTEDRSKLQSAWAQAVVKVGGHLATQSVAFVTLGDPLLYGTYLYLYRGIKESFPDVNFITVPGIPGLCAVAACSNFYLTAENDRLLLLTGKVELNKFEEYCRSFETIVIYKPRADFRNLIQCFFDVAPAGTGVIVERCGMIEEKIIHLNRDYCPYEIDYFTIAILHPKES
jgi:precorrin-2/cobalt-factor-2 C20-methyltransferase